MAYYPSQMLLPPAGQGGGGETLVRLYLNKYLSYGVVFLTFRCQSPLLNSYRLVFVNVFLFRAGRNCLSAFISILSAFCFEESNTRLDLVDHSKLLRSLGLGRKTHSRDPASDPYIIRKHKGVIGKVCILFQ